MPSSGMEGFIDRLHQAMTNCEIDQQELGHRLGISPSAISEWVHRGRIPKWQNLSQAAVILGVNVEWLAYGAPHPRDPRPPQTPKAATRDAIRALMEELHQLLKELEARYTGETTQAARDLGTARADDRRTKRTPGRRSPRGKKRDA